MAAFAHRADAPSQLWAGMLERVRTNLDLLGYAMLFFPEQHPQLARLLDEKCARGLRVRIALADPGRRGSGGARPAGRARRHPAGPDSLDGPNAEAIGLRPGVGIWFRMEFDIWDRPKRM